jgi:hypothetical protein
LDGRAEGVYVVLNRLDPVLLARAANRLQSKPKYTTSDADIIQRRWLYLDADPNRPAGISSTDYEHEAALKRVIQVREFLQSRGWPEPIEADSGNGGHLLYLLPPLDVQRAGELVKACLKAIGARFSDGVVAIDQSTATAARLCKLYGTQSRKGDATAERPHCRARILDEPEWIEPVSVDALEALAREAQAPPPPTMDRFREPAIEGLNIEEWLAARGLELIRGPEPWEGGRRWTLATCPFNPEHQKPVVIQFPSGAMCYKCLHKSCAQNDWKALRRRVEPDHRETTEKSSSALVTCIDQVPFITDLSQIPSVWNLEASLEWCVQDMIAPGAASR